MTITSVAALALAIGSITTVFSVVDAVLIRDYPYTRTDKLVFLSGRDTQTGEAQKPISFPNFADIRDQVRSLDDVAAFASRSVTMDGPDGPELIPALRVSHGFFRALGVAPFLGQVELSQNESSNTERFVALSHGLWQRRFGSSADVVGKILKLGDQPCTIVGVLRPEFSFRPSPLTNPELWLSLAPSEVELTRRESSWLHLIGRLNPTATLDVLNSDLSSLSARLAVEHPDTNARSGFAATSLRKHFLGNQDQVLFAILGAVTFVFLIACANVASLLLARGLVRRQQTGVRIALGAGPARLIKDALTESILLACAGGFIGLLLARAALGLLFRLSPRGIPRIDEISLDWRVVGFTVVASILAGAVSGILPALRSSWVDVIGTLKGRTESQAQPGRLRRLFVVFEVALAMTLTVGAGLMLNSLLRLTGIDPGFDPENVLTMQMTPLSPRKNSDLVTFVQDTLTRIRQVPAVADAGVVDFLPLASGGATTTSRKSSLVGDGAAGQPDDEINFESRAATSEYFHVLRIPIRRGASFDEMPSGSQLRTVLVSERLADLLWPGEDVVGKRWLAPVLKERAPLIVGVVADVRHYAVNQEPRPTLYSSYYQTPRQQITLVVRASHDPHDLIPLIRGQILSVDPNVVITDVRGMEERLAESVALPRFYTWLFGWFAVLASVLAAVSVYGLVSYSVTSRMHEIAIRMALGARRFDILRLVVGEGVVAVVVGLVIGLCTAAALTRSITSLLYNLSPIDFTTFISTAALIGLAGILACYLPARKGAQVDPVTSLRYE